MGDDDDGYNTPSAFQRYNIVSEGDVKDAARRLDAMTTSAPIQAAREHVPILKGRRSSNGARHHR